MRELKVVLQELKVDSDMDTEPFRDALRTNFVLESLDIRVGNEDIERLCNVVGRLNQAGRKYLIEEKLSLSKGIKVLASVSDSPDCLYYHLRENLALCGVSECGKNEVEFEATDQERMGIDEVE